MPSSVIVFGFVPAIARSLYSVRLSARNLGIDELLIRDPWAQVGDSPRRPDPFTPVALGLLATALWLTIRQTRLAVAALRSHCPRGQLVRIGELIPWGGLIIAVPGTHAFTLPSALSVLALAYGTLSLRPEEGLVGALSSDALAGTSARRPIGFVAKFFSLLDLESGACEAGGWIVPPRSASSRSAAPTWHPGTETREP